jgi:hypothetical protein
VQERGNVAAKRRFAGRERAVEVENEELFDDVPPVRGYRWLPTFMGQPPP